MKRILTILVIIVAAVIIFFVLRQVRSNNLDTHRNSIFNDDDIIGATDLPGSI